ncbi:hypothetical protein TrST_g7849 [Triparma strigata]|uniref:Kinesin light chain n=1 Tax=Triparma strigata TaxID=1606541 RepID=A0A9W7B1T1_9STRA|nr:hypothetical protein TrST_g7849 [Triparma strigata]
MEKLRALEKLCSPEFFDDPSLLVAVSRRILEVLELAMPAEEARKVYERCLAGREKVLGEDHGKTLATVNNLGIVSDKLKDYEKALEYYERALKEREKILGKAHPDTLRTVMNIGIVYAMNGDLQSAAENFRKVVEGNVAQLDAQSVN